MLRALIPSAFAVCLFVVAPARAQIVLDGEVPTTDGVAYFTLPFDVPAGTVEIEVRHDDLSATNILDWGVLSPDGFRGYGGGNTEPAVIGVAASSRSYLVGPITPGTWQVYVGEANVTELPARYHVEIDLRTTATLAPQPERAPYAPAVALATTARWYAGDFHVHSRESGDASPTLDEIATYAESIGLDFVMLSEHNTVSQLELLASVQARHPSVLLVPGIEVTTYQGHFMSLGGTHWIDHRLGVMGRTLDDVAADAHGDGALFTANHPALTLGSACIGCAWTAPVDPGAIDGIEVQTGRYSVTGRLFFPMVVSRWEDLVMAGHHVIALGGSDDHSAGRGTGAFDSPIGSPTTMVYAEELSVAGLMAGLRAGRTVVRLEGNDDPMIELSSADLPAHGDTIVADTTTLVVHVTGAELGASLRLVRDGVPGPEQDATGADLRIDFPVIAGANDAAIRAELLVGSRPRVVTSHVFLRAVTPGGPDAGPIDAGPFDGSVDAGEVDAGPPAPRGGCGCAVGRSESWPAGTALLALGLLLARRRRVRGSGSTRS